jgi:hypothetical protein
MLAAKNPGIIFIRMMFRSLSTKVHRRVLAAIWSEKGIKRGVTGHGSRDKQLQLSFSWVLWAGTALTLWFGVRFYCRSRLRWLCCVVLHRTSCRFSHSLVPNDPFRPFYLIYADFLRNIQYTDTCTSANILRAPLHWNWIEHSYYWGRWRWAAVTLVCTGKPKAVALLTAILLDSEQEIRAFNGINVSYFPSDISKSYIALLGLLDTEDEGITIFRNVGNYSYYDKMSCPRRLESSCIRHKFSGRSYTYTFQRNQYKHRSYGRVSLKLYWSNIIIRRDKYVSLRPSLYTLQLSGSETEFVIRIRLLHKWGLLWSLRNRTVRLCMYTILMYNTILYVFQK